MARVIKDKHSLEWIQTRDHTEGRLEELRDDLEQPFLGDDETNILRGQIMYAREILGLDQDDEVADVPDTSYLPES